MAQGLEQVWNMTALICMVISGVNGIAEGAEHATVLSTYCKGLQLYTIEVILTVFST